MCLVSTNKKVTNFTLRFFFLFSKFILSFEISSNCLILSIKKENIDIEDTLWRGNDTVAKTHLHVPNCYAIQNILTSETFETFKRKTIELHVNDDQKNPIIFWNWKENRILTIKNLLKSLSIYIIILLILKTVWCDNAS